MYTKVSDLSSRYCHQAWVLHELLMFGYSKCRQLFVPMSVSTTDDEQMLSFFKGGWLLRWRVQARKGRFPFLLLLSKLCCGRLMTGVCLSLG